MKNIVVLGATGHFGKRIAQRIVNESNIRLIVTSREIGKVDLLAQDLAGLDPSKEIQAAVLDQASADFESDLADLNPYIVIHTAGPYQRQDYRVAEACIACGSHYVDLADGRAFVDQFSRLNDLAVRRAVLLVSGASTLPGLSSAVLNDFKSRFEKIEEIEISIAPAHETPRGMGTVSAVLSYCGKPFNVLENGEWLTRYGWQDLKSFRYPELGWRLGGACDVPDLRLFPKYQNEVKTVTFHASLEAKWEQIALWLMAWAVRLRIVSDWSRYARSFQRVSQRFTNLGSDRGGMHIRLRGLAQHGRPYAVTWYLTAYQNHGPEIPCTPALIIARRLASGQLKTRGAVPCIGLFTLADFDQEMSEYQVYWKIEESD